MAVHGPGWMTDLEAVREMRNSNKQRGDPLPSELAKLLDLEVEAIKRQGARPKTEKEAEALGKLSVEIVGKDHDMNYKKVMRYIRLNSLVPELLDKVDAKQMGFMPAVEISYIRPENQRLIAVSIDGEQSSPSVAQAKRLHELDKEGKLNGDVIDGRPLFSRLSGGALEGAGMILPPAPVFTDKSNILRPPPFGTLCPRGRGAWKEVLWTKIKAIPFFVPPCWKTAGALPWGSIPQPRPAM